MEYVLAVTERRRLLVPLPFPLDEAARRPSCSTCPTPLLTPDQVELLKADNVVSAAAHERGPHAATASASCRPRWR